MCSKGILVYEGGEVKVVAIVGNVGGVVLRRSV
jgi:hypothetical protein